MSPAVLGGCKSTDAKPNGGMAGGCMLGDIASGGIIGGIPGDLIGGMPGIVMEPGGIIGGIPGGLMSGGNIGGPPKLLLLAGMLLPSGAQPAADFALAAALPCLSYARESKCILE